MICAVIAGAAYTRGAGAPLLEGAIQTNLGEIDAKVSAWTPMPDELWRLLRGASVYVVTTIKDGVVQLHVMAGERPEDKDEDDPDSFDGVMFPNPEGPLWLFEGGDEEA